MPKCSALLYVWDLDPDKGELVRSSESCPEDASWSIKSVEDETSEEKFVGNVCHNHLTSTLFDSCDNLGYEHISFKVESLWKEKVRA